MSSSSSFKVTFLHLDLGIGGAERLVVDCASELKRRGYDVRIITSHHDPEHSFSETNERGGSGLGDVIEVYGDWLPRYINIVWLTRFWNKSKQSDRRFTALCGIIRMVYISCAFIVQMLLSTEGIGSGQVVFLDGLSATIPIMRAFGVPVLFYCHFPDKLLSPIRTTSQAYSSLSASLFKKLGEGYRLVVDWIEDVSMSQAALIAVNSEFTASVCRESFPFLRNPGNQAAPLVVVYPAVNCEAISANDELRNPDLVAYASNYDQVFVSLNRYERKKRLEIAILAFSQLLETIKVHDHAPNILLVVAGGYDEAVEENITYHKELVALVAELQLSDRVVFRRSIGNDERIELLNIASALLYTPEREHFGIVPIEAMAAGVPVIAVASGGPLETVLDGVTGFLCLQEANAFAEAMLKFIVYKNDYRDHSLRSEMGNAGMKRVKDLFSSQALGDKLDACLKKIVESVKPPGLIFLSIWVVLLVMLGQAIGLILKFLFVSITGFTGVGLTTDF